jgi:hypothetical protein
MHVYNNSARFLLNNAIELFVLHNAPLLGDMGVDATAKKIAIMREDRFRWPKPDETVSDNGKRRHVDIWFRRYVIHAIEYSIGMTSEFRATITHGFEADAIEALRHLIVRTE